MRTIRASEIGSFVYCQRAWWYRISGISPENIAELYAGSEWHEQHGRGVAVSVWLRAAAFLLFAIAAVLILLWFQTS